MGAATSGDHQEGLFQTCLCRFLTALILLSLASRFSWASLVTSSIRFCRFCLILFKASISAASAAVWGVDKQLRD